MVCPFTYILKEGKEDLRHREKTFGIIKIIQCFHYDSIKQKSDDTDITLCKSPQ